MASKSKSYTIAHKTSAKVSVMKVLIVKLKQIGDAVLALPVCGSLRKSDPNARIHYMLYEHIAPLFENHPSIDKIITVSPKQRESKLAFADLLRQIKQQKYDAVLDTINTPTSLLITRASGAKIQAGIVNKKWRTRLYKNKVYQSERAAGRRKVSILEALNIPLELDYSIDIHLRNDEINQMRQQIAKAGISSEQPLIAMMVHSRRDYKIWPKVYFVELANYLIEKYNAQIYFVHGPGEEQAVSDVASEVKSSDNVFIQPKTRHIRDLACLLKCTDFFIGNDGGPRHIAQAVGTPTFSIFSPLINKTEWLPNYPDSNHQAIDMADIDMPKVDKIVNKRCLQDYYLKITPDMAIKIIDQMLRDISIFKSSELKSSCV